MCFAALKSATSTVTARKGSRVHHRITKLTCRFPVANGVFVKIAKAGSRTVRASCRRRVPGPRRPDRYDNASYRYKPRYDGRPNLRSWRIYARKIGEKNGLHVNGESSSTSIDIPLEDFSAWTPRRKVKILGSHLRTQIAAPTAGVSKTG